MESIHFRNGTKKDIGVLAELFRETVCRINSRDYSPEQIAAWTGGATPKRWDGLFSGALPVYSCRTGYGWSDTRFYSSRSGVSTFAVRACGIPKPGHRIGIVGAGGSICAYAGCRSDHFRSEFDGPAPFLSEKVIGWIGNSKSIEAAFC